MSITWLETTSDNQFPPVEQAFDDGLLAAGGDLSTERLLSAYRHGIFPWFNKNDPILWWSPDPRMVLFTDSIKLSKSLKKTLRNHQFTITLDNAFEQVMLACSKPRSSQELDPENSSWIHPQMISAYTQLHQLGYAHSIECWQDNKLVGGLYGVAIGKAFFGESMFSHVRDSSKVALVALCQQLQRLGYPMIDCQVHSDHLASLGAQQINRNDFIEHLNNLCQQPQTLSRWQLDDDLPEIP
ncbi:leucyl/phenylalanyl-tRNA--protein transferase [Methylophaga sp. 41_12_T18]|nr:leucyl/phenylalanyl-tRNA--protein transferase [Methylophaga sp. 41_12_T18]